MKNLLSNLKYQALGHGLWEGILLSLCFGLVQSFDVINDPAIGSELAKIGVPVVLLRIIIAILMAVGLKAGGSVFHLDFSSINKTLKENGFKNEQDFINTITEVVRNTPQLQSIDPALIGKALNDIVTPETAPDNQVQYEITPSVLKSTEDLPLSPEIPAISEVGETPLQPATQPANQPVTDSIPQNIPNTPESIPTQSEEPILNADLRQVSAF